MTDSDDDGGGSDCCWFFGIYGPTLWKIALHRAYSCTHTLHHTHRTKGRKITKYNKTVFFSLFFSSRPIDFGKMIIVFTDPLAKLIIITHRIVTILFDCIWFIFEYNFEVNDTVLRRIFFSKYARCMHFKAWY